MPSTPPTRILRVIAAVGGALALTAGLAACGSSDGAAGSDTTSLTITTPAEPSTFDPHDGSSQGFLAVQPAYDTLLQVDEAGEPQPWLATAWEFVEPTRLQLTLRDGVSFSDGTPFDASAVKANLEHARDIPQGNGYQAYFANITAVEALDPLTVQVVLAQPNPGMPVDLAQQSGQMVSPAALGTPAIAQGPVGTGPYVLDTSRTRTGLTYTYVRNEDYWAADQNRYPFDEITYAVNADPTAARNAAAAGDADVVTLLPGTEVAGFETVASTSGENSGYTGIWIDISGGAHPALADVRVRQAMNYAIDRRTIAATIFEGAAVPVAAVPVTEDSPAYSPALAEMYPFDPDRARQLLAEAGAADGFPIRMLTAPQAERTAQAIAANLRDVGIDAELATFSGPELPQQLHSGAYGTGVPLQRLTGEPGQDIRALFTETAFFNTAGASDPEIDRLLNVAALEPDEAARNAIYQQLAVHAAEQAWFAGALVQQQITAYDPEVVSVTPPPFGEIQLYHYQLPS